MKYDLLFSDIVAFVAGLFGLLAAAITLQKALQWWMYGDPLNGVYLALFGLGLFLFARCFLISKPYTRMLRIAAHWTIRVPFFSLCVLWLLIIGLIFDATSPWDLVGLPSYMPWLFSTQAVVVVAVLFILVFLVPGFAYRPYRNSGETQDAGGIHAQTFEPNSAVLYGNKNSAKPLVRNKGPISKALEAVLGLAALAIIGSGIYGMTYAQFISSAAHVAYVKQFLVWIVLGTALCLYGLLYLISNGKGKIRNPIARFVVASVLVVPFSLVSGPAAQSGLPALLSLLEKGSYDNPIEITVVKRIGSATSRRSCDRKATVLWEVHNRQLCNVPDHIWQDLRPGQKLELEGYLTDYGFRYERIRRVDG